MCVFIISMYMYIQLFVEFPAVKISEVSLLYTFTHIHEYI